VTDLHRASANPVGEVELFLGISSERVALYGAPCLHIEVRPASLFLSIPETLSYSAMPNSPHRNPYDSRNAIRCRTSTNISSLRAR
jgi:hypothetical protein